MNFISAEVLFALKRSLCVPLLMLVSSGLTRMIFVAASVVAAPFP
ncbi:hypothetical protein [Chryseobacterium carnipullorum]|nr:hypothetical protein [Chryseobacterium carnipullorum]